MFNQLTGINAITIYSTHLFNNLHIPSSIGSIIVGVSQFVGVIVGGILVKIGMGFKLMLILAHISIGILLVGVAFFSYYVNEGKTEYSTPLVCCLTGIMFLF